jgi:hypothetical protein
MRYFQAAPENTASLKEGEMLFKLRSTNITILPGSACQAKNSLDAATPANACKKNDTRPDVSCIADVIVKTTVISDGDYYIAVPGDRNPWARTGLSAETVDGDASIIKTVTVSFNDQTKQEITRAGTGAAAGFGIAGPYGAIAGAILGAATSLPDRPKKAEAIKTEKESFINRICKSDKVTADNVNKPDNSALILPVTINLKEALPVDGDDELCWHLLPDNPFADGKGNGKGNGWLYRIVLEDKPFGAQSPSKYFAKDNSGEPRHDFPFTPCQDAKLHLVWWATVQAAMPEKGSQKDLKFKYNSFPITVANPEFIQVVPLPRAGKIKLGAVCGASVTYDTYSGPTTGDDFDAAVTVAKNIKSAQDEYKKAQSKSE